MRKTPSHLKGLAETRARAAADVQRYRNLLEDIKVKLVEAESDLAACDRLIRKFDSRLNPELIQPINAYKGRYGGHGQLRDSILEYLQSSYPADVSTAEIGCAMQLKFNVDFPTPEAKARWQHNSIGRALNVLIAKNQIERLHEASKPSAEVGRWRYKSDDAPSLDHLKAQAAARGVSVQQADDGPE